MKGAKGHKVIAIVCGSWDVKRSRWSQTHSTHEFGRVPGLKVEQVEGFFMGLWEFAWRTYRIPELFRVSCVMPPNKVQPAVAWGSQYPDHAKSQRAKEVSVQGDI